IFLSLAVVYMKMATVTQVKYGAMIDENITTAGKSKINLQAILEKQDYALLKHYQHAKAYEPSTVMFGTLAMLGHFGRNSQYCHYLSDDVFPINLYCVLVGPSGSGKTSIIKRIKQASRKCERTFTDFYLKEMEFDGKIKTVTSIISNVNNLSLRKHLATGNKLLVNDEIDVFFDPQGVYDSTTNKTVGDVGLLLQAFDGITDDDRTTGSTSVYIEQAHLSILGGTTGTHYSTLLSCFEKYRGFEGIHNRMLYLVLEPFDPIRPQHLRKGKRSKNMPTLAHYAIIAHLFGDVQYEWQMSDEEKQRKQRGSYC
ncbi:unnamed protein product, partial [Didymodactylos carnosus]